MPAIKLTVSGTADRELSARLAEQVAGLTCTVLGKEPGRTMVMVCYVPHDQWFIAGTSLAAHGKNSFRLEITVVEGTNTRDQKIEYHRRAFELLSTLIGNVHSYSNIHVIDCAATGYGYGGVTQEWHYQHRKSAVVSSAAV